MSDLSKYAEVDWETVPFRAVKITLKNERALEMMKEIMNHASLSRNYADELCPGFACSLLEALPDRAD